MRRRISIKRWVRPSVRPSVCRSVRRSVTPVQKRDPGASNCQYWFLLFFVDRLSYNRYQAISCPDSALSLDECWVRPESQCRSSGYYSHRHTHGTVRLRCGDEPNNATLSSSGQRCARGVQSAASVKASSANCENLHWFVCEAKPEIIHDVRGWSYLTRICDSRSAALPHFVLFFFSELFFFHFPPHPWVGFLVCFKSLLSSYLLTTDLINQHVSLIWSTSTFLLGETEWPPWGLE